MAEGDWTGAFIDESGTLTVLDDALNHLPRIVREAASAVKLLVNGEKVRDRHIETLAGLKQVTEITLLQGKRLTDEAFVHIVSFPKLQRLDVSCLLSKTVTSRGIKLLSKMGGLEIIRLPSHMFSELEPLAKWLEAQLPECVITR